MMVAILVLPMCVHAVHRVSCAGYFTFTCTLYNVAVSVCGYLTAVSSNAGGDCQYD